MKPISRQFILTLTLPGINGSLTVTASLYGDPELPLGESVSVNVKNDTIFPRIDMGLKIVDLKATVKGGD